MKKKTRKCGLFFVITGCIGLFVSGCATHPPVKAYIGPDRADLETVLLTGDCEQFFTDVYGVYITSIRDNNENIIWEGSSNAVRVLPGEYLVEVLYNSGGGSPAGLIPALIVHSVREKAKGRLMSTLKVNCEAGKQYQVKYKKTGLFMWDWQVTFWVEDMESGKVVTGTRPS